MEAQAQKIISERKEMGGGTVIGQKEKCLRSDTIHHGGRGWKQELELVGHSVTMVGTL